MRNGRLSLLAIVLALALSGCAQQRSAETTTLESGAGESGTAEAAVESAVESGASADGDTGLEGGLGQAVPPPPPPPPPPLPSPAPFPEARPEPSVPATGRPPTASRPPSPTMPPTTPPTPGAVLPSRPAIAFPQFPCRPPNPSDLVTMGHDRVLPAGVAPTLGAVEARLKGAFITAGFRQPRVYQTCGGFVVVTSIERARADGRPFAEPGRFVDLDRSMSAIEDFSLAGVLRALLTVQPGRFRMIAIVVSDQDLAPTGETMSSAAATASSTGGAVRLPQPLARLPFTPGHAVTALVYEFEKPPGSAAARLALPPRFSADQHLRLAGVIDALSR